MPNPVTTLADDAKAALLEIITTATTSIQKNPGTGNIAAQGAFALASLIPMLPELQAEAITAVATTLQEAAQKALAPAPVVPAVPG